MNWVKIWLWRAGMVQVWGQVNLGCLYVPPAFLNLCQDYQVNVFWECRNGTLNSHHPKANEAIWDLQQRLYCFAFIWLCDILTRVVSHTTVTEFVLAQFPAVIQYIVYTVIPPYFLRFPLSPIFPIPFTPSTQVHFPDPCVFFCFEATEFSQCMCFTVSLEVSTHSVASSHHDLGISFILLI